MRHGPRSTRAGSSAPARRAGKNIAPPAAISTTIMAAATAEKLAALLDRVAKGELRVNIETAIPLERAPEAFAAFADGTLGKVLITR